MLHFFVLEVVLILIITAYAWHYKRCCFKPATTPARALHPIQGLERSPDALVVQMPAVFACPGCRTNIQPPPGVALFACPRCKTTMQLFLPPPPPMMQPGPLNPEAQPRPSSPEYVSDEEVELPYSANWSSPWRAFSPCTWDTNADHWQEPADEPVLAPYIERFAYYICMRHELLRLVFVKRNDTLRRPDRILVLLITIYAALHFTAQWSKSTQEKRNDDGYNDKTEEEKENIALSNSVITAAFIGLLDVVLCSISRLRCANFKIGRLLSIPFAFLCLLGFNFTMYGILNGELADENTIGWWFVSLLWGWALATPVNIAVRVWLYGRGYTTLGLGPKRRLLGDLCASSVTNPVV